MLLVLSTAILLLWVSERRLVALAVPIMALNISFLWVIESMTGVLLLCAVVFLFLISAEASVLRKVQRRILRVVVPLIFVVAAAYVTKLAYDYFEVPENHAEGLQSHSALGAPYEHHLENTLRENGHFIWRNIARDELVVEWSQRSEIPLDSNDARGHQVYGTLLRYMTSLGLTKDAEGLSHLTTHDIANVEAGVPSILEMEHSGLRRRLDKIFFEIALLQNGGNPSGNSVTQRIEFWRAAWHVIEQKPLFGVGTGDVKSAMDSAYITIDSRLYAAFRLRAHNQYLTFWMAFGVFGMLLLIATLFLPLGVGVTERGFLFSAFCVIVALSYLTEDTLETQAGVTMVAFFSALFAAQRLAFHARIRSAT
jgi:O-antigen ligase